MITIAAIGLLLRLGFVLWAPGDVSGDAFFYHGSAILLLKTGSYVWFDGSPSVQWMPGWPLTLAGLYAIFGVHTKVGMVANALFGTATACLLAVLGGLLFDKRTGRIAGLLYAVWPGNIYYTATLFTESEFNFLLVGCLTCLAAGGRAVGARRVPWFLAAGVMLGLCAMVKAEPLTLTPVVLVFLWTSRRTAPAFGRELAAMALATAVVLAPWVHRNYTLFGRLMVTSASGGTVAWLGAHTVPPWDFFASVTYMRQHKRISYADTLFAASADGWKDAWKFARSHPAAWAAVQRGKLAATYLRDGEGAAAVKGVGPQMAFIGDRALAVLMVLADAFWWGVLGLAALGLRTVRSWWTPARVLVFGLPATWLVLHVLMVAGPRFHVPETLCLALLAARALATPSPGRVEA